MKKVVALLFLVANSSFYGCPTCIGLPRSPHERPFFERKSFLAAIQQPKTQKQQSSPQKEVHDKQSQEKN
jgi:hypothetical protein